MRVCTWNSLGDKFDGGYVSQLLSGLDIDVLCLQECGNLARYFSHETKETDLSLCFKTVYKAGRNGYTLIYNIWNVGGRCNMAMLVRDNIQIDNVYRNKTRILYDGSGEELQDMPCYSEKSLVREMITVEMTAGGTSYTINNIHLPSGHPQFARKIGYRLFCNYQMRS